MVVWDFPTQHMLVLQATDKQVYELVQQKSECRRSAGTNKQKGI